MSLIHHASRNASQSNRSTTAPDQKLVPEGAMIGHSQNGKKPNGLWPKTTRQLASAALIAALYCALSLAIPAFGVLQLRLGEALTVFAAFSPMAVIGLTVGCFLTNLIGLFMGLTIPTDLLFGTFATLIAALGSYLLRRVRFRKVPFLIWLPPVLSNGVIIGWMLTFFLKVPGGFFLTAGTVALEEIIPCLVLGMPLFVLCDRVKPLQKFFAGEVTSAKSNGSASSPSPTAANPSHTD